ncbi:MAG: ABC transporter ATP-binding protein [Caldilineaceae bacterium SB0661_bin_34]|nr:ABC transporter ATP-binding protein [Caldilineaceae bacterium SB0661_bin_34]
MHAIAIENLSKSYRASRNKTVQAVSNLDLTVSTGEVIGFLGPNGAGKTTTIKLICGLVLPDQGTVTVLNHDVHRQTRRVMQLMGAVLEGTRNIYWRLTPLQNLAYSARIKGIPATAVHNWGRVLLEDLDLWDRRNDPVRMFSRGMQQKTAIACALIHRPSLVLLDEPTLGLDVEAAVTVKEWIRTLSIRYGMTLVLTTHQLDLAEELCQRVVIIQNGVKVTDQAVADLKRLHKQELFLVQAEGDPVEIGWRASVQWPGATVKQEEDGAQISIPANGNTSLTAIATAMNDWPARINSIAQAMPSLEDIFIQETRRTANHE